LTTRISPAKGDGFGFRPFLFSVSEETNITIESTTASSVGCEMHLNIDRLKYTL